MGKHQYKRWAKRITDVDTSKTDGYAFVGDFMPKTPVNVKHGDLFLLYGESGPVAQARRPTVALVRGAQRPNGSYFEFIYEWKELDWAWAPQIMDEVCKQIGLNYARNHMEETYGLVIEKMRQEDAREAGKGYGIEYTFTYQGETHDFVDLEEAVAVACQETGKQVPKPPREQKVASLLDRIECCVAETPIMADDLWFYGGQLSGLFLLDAEVDNVGSQLHDMVFTLRSHPEKREERMKWLRKIVAQEMAKYQ